MKVDVRIVETAEFFMFVTNCTKVWDKSNNV